MKIVPISRNNDTMIDAASTIGGEGSGGGGGGGGGAKRFVKGPHEDAWLRTFHDPDADRNLLHSLRRVVLNPDLMPLRNYQCYCGNDVRLQDSWHVMVTDGTLVCNSCACCHCCGRQSLPNSRRLVCVDGLVLCYGCLRFYGYRRKQKLRIRLVPNAYKDPLKISSSAADDAAETDGDQQPPDNRSNCEYYDYNVPRENRNLYTAKEDFRRRMRAYYYDVQARRLPKEDDPCEVAPVYLAEDSRPRPMQCPACNSIALGRSAYTVPSMGRVFHRRCLRCCSCKESLAHGIRIAGVSFQFCSCDVPMVWCGKYACREARMLHHRTAKCRLGCIRPGGRLQMDYTHESSGNEQPGRRRKRQQHSQPQQHHQQQHSQQTRRDAPKPA